jgi:hypothetical protein
MDRWFITDFLVRFPLRRLWTCLDGSTLYLYGMWCIWGSLLACLNYRDTGCI